MVGSLLLHVILQSDCFVYVFEQQAAEFVIGGVVKYLNQVVTFAQEVHTYLSHYHVLLIVTLNLILENQFSRYLLSASLGKLSA
jgi:hypothetical protein